MVSKIKRKLLIGVCLLGLLQACSTTVSDARQYLIEVSQAQISSYDLYVDKSRLVTASQEGGGLYKLHHSASEVQLMVANVASKFGFRSVSHDQATYVAMLKSASPDGGACENPDEAARGGAAYTASVLTLGLMPAARSHCYVVVLALYERIDGELLLVGEFLSNKGRVDTYAGAGEIDNYALIVTKRDEELALETSVAALFQQMIVDGAFE